MVKYLVNELPYQVNRELSLMDEHRYLFLKQFVSDDNKVFQVVEADAYDNELAYYWRKTGIILSGSVDGQKILFMPSELQDIFQDFDHKALQNKLKQNTEWLLLTYGMLYYYGVMGYMNILSRLEELTGVRPDHYEFHSILLRASEYYGAPQMDSYGYWAHQKIQDIDAVLKEHQARPEVHYYRFSKSKLLKAGQPNYFDDNPAFRRLNQFFNDHFEMTAKEATQITQECQHIVNQINRPSAIFDFLQTKFTFPDYESVQLLAEVVMFFWNNTRQWTLKGHSPAELSTEAKLGPSSLPENLPLPICASLPFAAPLAQPAPSSPTTGKPLSKSPNNNIIDLKTRQKVGRNAPCPCESGKKFKQCCGRL